MVLKVEFSPDAPSVCVIQIFFVFIYPHFKLLFLNLFLILQEIAKNFNLLACEKI